MVQVLVSSLTCTLTLLNYELKFSSNLSPRSHHPPHSRLDPDLNCIIFNVEVSDCIMMYVNLLLVSRLTCSFRLHDDEDAALDLNHATVDCICMIIDMQA